MWVLNTSHVTQMKSQTSTIFSMNLYDDISFSHSQSESTGFGSFAEVEISILQLSLWNITWIFSVESTIVQKTLDEIYDALEERGYNPINQIVGYILSGDAGYISSYKDSRKKILSLDRAKIVETLLKNYIKWDI